MEYINSISIGNYKGIRRLNIDSFSSINIITGPNGSGNTALLNGLEILTNPSDFFHYIKASGKTFESFKNSFHKREPRPCSNIAGLVLQNFYGIEITSYFPIDNESFIGYHHFTYQAEKEKKVKNKSMYSFIDRSPFAFHPENQAHFPNEFGMPVHHRLFDRMWFLCRNAAAEL